MNHKSNKNLIFKIFSAAALLAILFGFVISGMTNTPANVTVIGDLAGNGYTVSQPVDVEPFEGFAYDFPPFPGKVVPGAAPCGYSWSS